LEGRVRLYIDEFVGLGILRSYLLASVGSCEENAGCLAGEGTGCAGGAKGAEALDDCLDGALLAEAGLGHGGSEGGEEEGFCEHGDGDGDGGRFRKKVERSEIKCRPSGFFCGIKNV